MNKLDGTKSVVAAKNGDQVSRGAPPFRVLGDEITQLLFYHAPCPLIIREDKEL